MDPITIITIIASCIAIVETILSYSPEGYPKSIFQCIVFIIEKIRKIKIRKIKIKRIKF